MGWEVRMTDRFGREGIERRKIRSGERGGLRVWRFE